MDKNKAVIISYYRWWNKRQKYFADWLTNHNYTVEFVTADYSHIQKAYTDGEEFPKNTIRLHVPAYRTNMSFQRIVSNYIFSKRVSDYLLKTKPEVIVCLIPTNLLCLALVEYKNRYRNTKVIIDVLDCWPESIPNQLIKKAGAFFLSKWEKIRKRGIEIADYIVLECLYYERILHLESNNNYEVLYLWNSTEPLHRDIAIDGKMVFAYIGSINNIIDIERIVTLLKYIKKDRQVLLKVIGKGDCEEQFLEKLNEAGIDTMFYGALFEREEIIEAFKDCHFGINVMKPGLAVGLTTKSVDYFSLGLPIINSIPEDTEYLINKYHAGVLLEDCVEKTAEMLCNIQNDEYHDLCEGATKLYSQELHVDKNIEKLDTIMNRVIK